MLQPAVYTNNNDKFVLKNLHPTVNHLDETDDNDELVLDHDFENEPEGPEEEDQESEYESNSDSDDEEHDDQHEGHEDPDDREDDNETL